MKHLQIFEEYNKDTHQILNANRKMIKSKFIKFIGRSASLIDDFIKLDFKSLKHSIKNKSGFEKLEYIISELSMLKDIIEKQDLSYDDFIKYEFDANDILKKMNDDDVIEYLNVDKKLQIDFISKYDDIINFLEEVIEYQKKI